MAQYLLCSAPFLEKAKTFRVHNKFCFHIHDDKEITSYFLKKILEKTVDFFLKKVKSTALVVFQIFGFLLHYRVCTYWEIVKNSGCNILLTLDVSGELLIELIT